MAHIERSIDFAVPVEKVWEALIDLASYPKWFVNLKSVHTTEPPRVGGSYTWKFNMAGIFPIEGSAAFTHIEPGVLLRTDNQSAVPAKWEWRLAPQGTGSRLTVTIDYTLPGSLAGRAVDKLVVEPQNERDTDKGLSQLKALLESAVSLHPAG